MSYSLKYALKEIARCHEMILTEVPDTLKNTFAAGAYSSDFYESARGKLSRVPVVFEMPSKPGRWLLVCSWTDTLLVFSSLESVRAYFSTHRLKRTW